MADGRTISVQIPCGYYRSAPGSHDRMTRMGGQ